MNEIFGFLLLIGMAWFVYMGAHIQEEQRQGKYIPLPWEEGGFLNKAKRKIFNKSDVVYRDGDNT
tara:strand:+ start:66 stop:260 length:195 start_codon:yes stop_codon:yes gene_type:complete